MYATIRYFYPHPNTLQAIVIGYKVLDPEKCRQQKPLLGKEERRGERGTRTPQLYYRTRAQKFFKRAHITKVFQLVGYESFRLGLPTKSLPAHTHPGHLD